MGQSSCFIARSFTVLKEPFVVTRNTAEALPAVLHLQSGIPSIVHWYQRLCSSCEVIHCRKNVVIPAKVSCDLLSKVLGPKCAVGCSSVLVLQVVLVGWRCSWCSPSQVPPNREIGKSRGGPSAWWDAVFHVIVDNRIFSYHYFKKHSVTEKYVTSSYNILFLICLLWYLLQSLGKLNFCQYRKGTLELL